MPTIPQRSASAFALFPGQYGDLTKTAREREQSRQSLYREAKHVIDAMDGLVTQARIDGLRHQLAEQRAEVQLAPQGSGTVRPAGPGSPRTLFLGVPQS